MRPNAKENGQIGCPPAADAILDRLVHNAHRIELRGESLRKTRAKKPETKSADSSLACLDFEKDKLVL